MGEYTPIFEQDWPYKAIDPSTVVWRYQSLEKFADMLATSALYFRRADKFPDDPMEGTLSPEDLHGTSESDRAFAKAYRVNPEEYANTVAGHEPMRRAVFVNCWHMNRVEDGRMWREYTDSPDSVVVRSTAEALKISLPPSVLMAGVTYIKKDEPRTRFDHASLFFFKDVGFKHEAELRLIAFKSPGETILWDDPADFGRKVAVDLDYIETVICHPSMSDATKAKVGELVRQHCPKAEVQNLRVEPW